MTILPKERGLNHEPFILFDTQAGRPVHLRGFHPAPDAGKMVQPALRLEASEDVPISSFPRRRDYKAVTVTTDMPTLLKAAIEQNFVPVVDDRNVFIGMVRRTVLLRELYDKYTTLPTDKRFKGSHPPM